MVTSRATVVLTPQRPGSIQNGNVHTKGKWFAWTVKDDVCGNITFKSHSSATKTVCSDERVKKVRKKERERESGTIVAKSWKLRHPVKFKRRHWFWNAIHRFSPRFFSSLFFFFFFSLLFVCYLVLKKWSSLSLLVKPSNYTSLLWLETLLPNLDLVSHPLKRKMANAKAHHVLRYVFQKWCLVQCANSLTFLWLCWLLLLLLLDYRTVTGVNGPLVILDNVKVSNASRLASCWLTEQLLNTSSPNSLKSLIWLFRMALFVLVKCLKFRATRLWSR